MSNIVFTWEIGQGYGHVMPLLTVARELKGQGHKVSFALRDVRGLGHALVAEGFGVTQAPCHPDRFIRAEEEQPRSMADVLKLLGFGDLRHLQGLQAAWSSLLLQSQADLVVASYAPLSLLCARALGLPTVLLALPFELPLPAHPCMDFRTGRPTASDAADSVVINNVNAAFLGRLKPLEAAHQIFEASRVFLMSFPELDPFGPRQGVNYIGNLFESRSGADVHWPRTSHRRRLFSYLHTGLPNLDLVRAELHALPMAISLCLRDATDDDLRRWTASNVLVTRDLVRMEQALNDCDAVLSYAGQGMVSASLCAGKPLALLTRDLETALTAQQVARLGAGIWLTGSDVKKLGVALTKLVYEDSWAAAARRFAALHGGHDTAAVARELAREIDLYAKARQ